MTTLIEQAVDQLKDVVSRENDDTVAIMRQLITERSQHVDFLEQWFSYHEQKIETERRAAVADVTTLLNQRYANMAAEVAKVKEAALSGAIKSVEELNMAIERFKK